MFYINTLNLFYIYYAINILCCLRRVFAYTITLKKKGR